MEEKRHDSAAGRIWRAAAAVVVGVVLVCALVNAWIDGGGAAGGALRTLSDDWYIVEDGEKVPAMFIELAKKSGEITLCNDGLSADDAGKTITTKGAQYGLTIRLCGETLYEYKETAFPRNTQMKSKLSCDAQIPYDFTGGTLELTLTLPDGGISAFSDVQVGSEDAVVFAHLKDSAGTLLLAFVFAALGVAALGIAIYLYRSAIDARQFTDAAMFLLICAVWFLTDSPVLQQYCENVPFLCVVSFYAFMLFSVPMLCLVKNTGNMQKYRVFDVLIGAFCANAAVQGILHLSLGVDFIDMLFATHLLLVVGVVIVMVYAVKESRENRDRDVRFILAAFSSVAVGGVLALVLYWLFAIPYYGSIFAAGVFLLVVLILADVTMSTVQNIHYRTEMQVYRRLEREDWMTGFWNRQPFEEYLAELERGEIACANAALIFIHICNLKRTNDAYGHAAGDEMVLSAARCIRDVFGSSGLCYRLDGDEFSVILTDPAGTKKEWFSRFRRTLEERNRRSDHPLSVICGWSDLLSPDGTRKNISNWKYDANEDLGKSRDGMGRA